MFWRLSLPVAGLAARGTLLADARDCRGAWAMLAEVAQWGTHVNRSVGVSYLMSAVGLSHDLRRLMFASFDKPQTTVVYITGIRKNRQMDEQSG